MSYIKYKTVIKKWFILGSVYWYVFDLSGKVKIIECDNFVILRSMLISHAVFGI